ncbi:GTP-binding protein [Ornithinibacillus salinisoli]|uniref:GTP-binding protein n=1 Tax=Ornithinibacillus salinisoli TaxID=1848459 RepID=A0ABW4W435_9BACI
MKKTIGVLAHVDAGKTTFSEQLLYHTKAIRNRGRVDHKDTFLDSHQIERDRGITVFADQAIFPYNDSIYYLIDTPGHVDFSPEMERAIQVMDYAIIIISAVEGVEGHTETVWQLLRKHQVPTFIFINKTDREGANVEKVIDEIRANLTKDVVDISTSLSMRDMNQELIEFIAERDEVLFDTFMDRGYDADRWFSSCKQLIKENQIYACSHGSALKDIGIQDFIEKIDQLTDTSYTSERDFAGRVYKIRYDDNGNRVTFLKVLQGTLQVRDQVEYGPEGGRIIEKITQLRNYNGNHYRTVEQVSAGELVGVVGLSHAVIGEGLGTYIHHVSFEIVPTLKSKVIFDTAISNKEMLQCFRKLDAEDPSLQVVWDEHFQEIYIHVMGMIQLEVLKKLVKERFHYDIGLEEPKILYKETIESTVVGYGHFEPLKHYAEVHLKIEPAPRNSGIVFTNNCHTNDLSIGNQHLIQRHLFERDHHGILSGSALTDVRITLLTGRGHHKHTSGGDFREATFRALRQGLEKANNMLLEPYYQFNIKVGQDEVGRVLSDIQQAHGSFEPPKTTGDKVTIIGKVPVINFMNYQVDLASFTHGKGMISLRFSGYDYCHNTEEVLQQIGYQKDADPLYVSSSIFCARGQGYTVPWDQVEKLMHCLD